MQIEIMLDKKQRISGDMMGTFQDEVTRRVHAIFPESTVCVREGAYTRIEMQGFALGEDKRRLNDLLQNVWEDDSWQH